ncbi:MAG: DnaA/Hda family protein [Thermoguttaceae bacterium]
MTHGVVDIPQPGKLPSADAASCRVRSGSRHDANGFLVGPENRLVNVAIRSVLEDQTRSYNPLVLYGPAGTGKSHLVQGLAAAWKARHASDARPASANRVHARHDGKPHPHLAKSRAENSKRRVVCTTAVDFARELADAIETQAVDDFRAKYRDAAMLVVEDLGQLTTRRSGKLSAQEELIHTLDALVADGRWAVVTAGDAPWALPGMTPMLQSRLASGLVIRLAPPGPETRRALLHRLAALRDIDLPDSVAQALAQGLSGTARDLAGALLQLATLEIDDSPTKAGKPSKHPTARSIDMPAVQNYLARQQHGRKVTLHEIALATAHHFSVRLTDLRSASRRRTLVAARGVAVYLARDVAGQGLEQIGRYFGGRDHTTVLHSYRTTRDVAAADPTIRTAIEALKKSLWKT